MIPARETVHHTVSRSLVRHGLVHGQIAGCLLSNTESYVCLHSQRDEIVSRH